MGVRRSEHVLRQDGLAVDARRSSQAGGHIADVRSRPAHPNRLGACRKLKTHGLGTCVSGLLCVSWQHEQGGIMRLSTYYYPDYTGFYCSTCDDDHVSVKVDSLEDDFVRVECPDCGEPTYVRVIF